jgi:uncharacterized protein YeaO (DUF488 family)
VRKEDYARRDYYDLWLPDLAPSAEVVKIALTEPFTPERWNSFVKRYSREMKEPSAQRLLTLLAALSHQTDFSVGCYCENADHCHRSILGELLAEHGAVIVSGS